ncbi:MAG: hypothetical protein AB7G28_17095 [Pirellulales bacterium]
MRALGLLCSVGLWIVCASLAVAQQSTSFTDRQIASCPAIFPILEGERSIVVPTVAPQFAQYKAKIPQLVSRPKVTAPNKTRSLLKRKIAEREELDREITALRAATKTPAQIVVRVQLFEVNLTKARREGIDLDRMYGGKVEVLADGTEKSSADQTDFVTTLQQKNLGKVLAEPTLVVADGRPASLCVGGEFPITSPDASRAEFRKYGTQLDLLAIMLGGNRVRIEMRPRLSELDPERSVKIGENEVPGLTVRECDLAREMELGTTTIVSGLKQERTESTVTDAGVRDEVIEVALLIAVRPEMVR